MTLRKALGIASVSLFIASALVAGESYLLGLCLFIASGALAMIDWGAGRSQ